jgi:hypothetical protein
MGWTQVIEYADAEVTLPPPVRKQVWDGEKFVPMTLYRHKGLVSVEAADWMLKTFGPAGTYKNGSYWDFSRSGDFTVMDEKVYTWFQLKWSNK